MEILKPESSQPIPKDAKKVFDGVLFDIYQWQQKMFDGSCETFEKARKPDTVNIIPVKDGKIFLTDQEQPGTKPFITVPGGRVDEGETVLRAAERELLEETGLVAGAMKLWFAYQPFEKIDWAVYNFIAHDCRETNKPRPDCGEKIKLLEVTFEEFLKISTQENFRNVEISLQFFRAQSNGGMEELRKMFLGNL